MYHHRTNWHSSATLTEIFPCFFLSCKANARVKPAKMGHGPHSSKMFVLLHVLLVLCRAACVLCAQHTTHMPLSQSALHTTHMPLSHSAQHTTHMPLSHSALHTTHMPLSHSALHTTHMPLNDMLPHHLIYIKRRNFTECFNINITLVRYR